ncbi:MAG: hypothetical protein GC160_07860 [Acidobacteria bacterium]|nr:hypothetical protein [Acidobacteriota bacterium]
MEEAPQQDMEQQEPSVAPPAEAEEDGRVALWGPSASGKTAFLALLYLRSTEFKKAGWTVYLGDQQTKEWLQDMRQTIDVRNRFPKATSAAIDRIRLSYVFVSQRSGHRFVLDTDDRPGLRYEEMDADVLQSLLRAKGRLFFFDHTGEPKRRRDQILRAFEDLHSAGRPYRETDLDPNPIAICLTKADMLIHSPEDLRRAREEPQEFVLERMEPELLSWAENYFTKIRLFPVSSVGVELLHGVVRPAIFFDERLEARWARVCQPLNLFEPFEWIFRSMDNDA